MKRFKKRTIALVLASVVTVVGAFGANNYKNSLTGLTFSKSGESVNVVVQTETELAEELSLMRKDAYTYVLTLPEINSITSTPSLKNVSGSVTSVNIRTMPYSNTAKGYTRVTIKMANPSISLETSNKVLPRAAMKELSAEMDPDYVVNEVPDNISQERHEAPPQPAYEPSERVVFEEDSQEQETEVEEPVERAVDSGMIETPLEPASQPLPSATSTNASSNTAYMGLWALLIVLCAAFFYAKAKDRMQEIAGESINVDVSDEKSAKGKNKKIDKIKKTIKTLDSAYSKTATMPNRSEYTEAVPIAPVKTAKPAEELDIVDLDELFKEHKAKSSPSKEDEENEALEEFLSGFSFDDEEETQIEPESGFDEECYERIVNNDNIIFTKDELSCINKLLDSEINDDTRRNIEKYAVSCPIKKVPSKKEVLEDIVSSYAISQNIIFSRDDVDALYKLINVELDNDFITDLRTNPQLTQEMEKDILAYGDKPKKPSEIVTLSVKDMLPDLSDALKKQGNKKIESNRKAETIYFSEGYEVSKLSLTDVLPDLSAEINKKGAYASKPSAAYDYVDTSYVVGAGELKISSELPNLQDVMAHPEKYEKSEPEKVVVDENALLNNISNVQFKPFYDGTNEFEVLNDFSDAPSVSDIQEELNQFEGFEVKQEEQIEPPVIQEEYDDFSALYNNEYVDLDEPKSENTKNSIGNKSLASQSAEDLMKKIEATKLERERRKVRLMQQEEIQKIEDSAKIETIETIRCILGNETYTIISSVAFDELKGCHLAKNEDGYAILGYVGNKLMLINKYDAFKSEKIHARLSEQLPDGISRYIVRVGVQKLIVNVKEDNIEYVMDLC